MRLLQRDDPRIDDPELKVGAPLPAEGSRHRPGLDQQIARLDEPFAVERRVDVVVASVSVTRSAEDAGDDAYRST